MLYPDFNNLLSYKRGRLDKIEINRRKVVMTGPGNYNSSFRGRGLEFDAVREYVPGDDIRSIDWRVTARTGSPHLKIFKEEKEHHTIICIDMNSYMRFGTRNTFKSVQAARSASFLGWRALARQDRISSCFFGDVPNGINYLRSKERGQTLSTMLKTLTEIPKEKHEIPLEIALNHISRFAHSGSLIYIISDFIELSPNISAELSRLNKNSDVVFISINDPADKVLIPAGMICFSKENNQKILINTNNVKGRQAYTLKWEENRRTLNSLTKQFKIPMIELSTESDIHSDLLLGLKKIAKRNKCLL
jgi:uncharacterized protein (DUF58 family)